MLKRLLFALIAFTLSIVITRSLMSWPGIAPPVGLEDVGYVFTEGPSNTLYVVMHGMLSDGASMGDVTETIRAHDPNAHIIAPTFHASLLSNARPATIANQLNIEIASLDAKNDYEHIRFVGHSIGAVIARQAYIAARGDFNQPAEYNDQLASCSADAIWTPEGVQRHGWVQKVDRMVLLAGMNGGWSRERLFGYSFFGALGDLYGVAKLGRSIEKGAPFIGNLRINWIRMSNQVANGCDARPLPIVVQLKGDDDRIISAEDDMDLYASGRQFIFITVDETGHGDLIDFDNKQYSVVFRLPNGWFEFVPSWQLNASDHVLSGRRSKLISALFDLESDLRTQYPLNSMLAQKDYETRHLVYVVHGIRDLGEWMDEFERELATVDQEARVLAMKYRRFPMLSFLLLKSRQNNVRRFADEFTDELARRPNLERISVIGHSNGSYIIASALEKYQALRLHNVYFAGSVVRTDYPWEDLIEARRVSAVRNDITEGDWVVAAGPGFYEQISPIMPKAVFGDFFDIGSAGHAGFKGSPSVNQFRYLSGDHGGAISDPENRKTIANFILDRPAKTGGALSPADLIVSKQPLNYVRHLGNMPWIVWLSAFSAAFGLGFVIWQVIKFIPSANPKFAIMIYVVFLITILNTF